MQVIDLLFYLLILPLFVMYDLRMRGANREPSPRPAFPAFPAGSPGCSPHCTGPPLPPPPRHRSAEAHQDNTLRTDNITG